MPSRIGSPSERSASKGGASAEAEALRSPQVGVVAQDRRAVPPGGNQLLMILDLQISAALPVVK
jgi:hypothetical protein